MKDFFISKNDINFSTYISELNPSQITTNGALTIIDNSNNEINGLVPNSNSIFLDNIFLASGYGFSSYADFDKASYLITTYNDSYQYLLDKIDDIKNQSFELIYSYEETENKLDRQYNKYGCLISYKYINISQDNLDNLNSYTINLLNYDCTYINNIEFIIDDNTEHNNNIVEIGTPVNCSYIFYLNKYISSLDTLNETIPDIFINGNKIDINDSDSHYTFDNNIIKYNYALEYNTNINNANILLECKRDNNIIYSYNYENFIKWRYKILPFNTNILNIYGLMSLEDIYNFDKFNFGNSDFKLNNISESIQEELSGFIDNNIDTNSIFLDDSIDIKFIGDGYNYNDELIYMYDYIAFNKNIDINEIEFYFNNIQDTGWKIIKFRIQEKDYTLLQSPQRYLGKHTWNIRFKK